MRPTQSQGGELYLVSDEAILNETDSSTGEEYQTYMLGGSIVGMPFFTYARTPFGGIGATALNPDITDVFVEDVRGEQYLDAADQ
jgi:hypothetical protein